MAPKYPFTPQLLDALPEELAELFRGLELTLLEEIASRLRISDNLNEVTIQDIRALQSHGIDLEDIKKAIAEVTDTGMDKLEKLLDDVVARNQAYYQEVIDIAQITAPDRLVEHEDIWAIYEQTKGEYRNITQSMGFLVQQGRHKVMLPPAQAYQHCLDSAVMQIQSGAISYNQAISRATRELASSGLRTVSYESGHVNQVGVAVRRAVMSAVNQINARYREQSGDYLQTDLVAVEAHAGARDTDGPHGWENHKKWQGRWYRWQKYTQMYPNASKGDYPDFETTCGYGSVTGILGANCRHSFSFVVEGVNERSYSDEYLAHIDDGLGCTFEGRKYSAYEATQMQRRLESEIRTQKRLKTAYGAAGLTDKATAANIRLRRLNQKYREFSKAAGLPEQRERMKVEYPWDITDIKKFAPLKEYQGDIRVVGQFSAKEYVVKLDPPTISGVTQHFSDNLINRPDRAGLTVEAARGIINSSKIVLYQPSNSTLKFLADNGYAVLNMQGKIVTAVPEKLRKKYRDYLEGK